MTTKNLSKKQIIIPISINNSEEVISQANKHISNINRLLKGVKSDVSTDYIYSDNKGVINADDIMRPQLPQLKSYLKILEVPYFLENTNLYITSDIVEMVIKNSHIFNDIVLAFQPHIIKTSSKLDMAMI